ncbi:hypothetical protein LZ023_16945 [Pseudomonas silvicola]|nr:hypothetical protein LZ023_16930 [Pseudomonas silvicola]WAH61092.1 hypothetical protein LZ023_16945 [Pseudomonas silvicola]
MQQLLDLLIRPRQKLSDTLFLCLAFMVGGGVGAVLAEKIAWSVGAPFGLMATVILHLMWRSPRLEH